MKKYFIIFSIFVVFAYGYYAFYPQVTEDKGIIYDLKAGTSKRTLLTQLHAIGVIPYPNIFSILFIFQKNASLKTGEYLFPKGSTVSSVWQQVTNGTGLVTHQFTIIPGWSFNQLRYELLQAKSLRHSITGLSDHQIMAHMGAADVLPEGLFFPETYNYTKGNSDLVILKRAYNLMVLRLNEAWQSRSPNLPYKDPYEALTAASLIEKEAFLNSERPIIAGVLVNRLKKQMLLQFDPTVIYALGQRYDGKLHKSDLSEQSAYNTYLKRGLPPTPIAIPSETSIMAALHPNQNEFLYFVARGDGSHVFSKTLSEHNSAVNTVSKPVAVKPLTRFFNEGKVRHYINHLFFSNL